MPPVVFIGDDFTGASDTLATFARAGWRSRLFLDAPSSADCAGFDAVGVATAMRAMSPIRAEAVVDRLWPTIKALSPRVIHLKVCSTFDSSASVGSIGATANALARRFKPDHIIVIGGQPSLGRYCVFGNLFARAADGATYRIDRHPVMAHHPVTPMAEADLRVLLAAQGLEGMRLVRSDELDDLPVGPGTRAVFDCSTVDDIAKIARVLRRVQGRVLLIGASSVEEALTHGGSGHSAGPAFERPSNDKVLVFAGSRSATTSAQVDAASRYEKICLLPDDLGQPQHVTARVCDQLDAGRPTLLYTDPNTDYGLSSDVLAEASASLLATILKRMPVGWFAIAGGDTSSRICQVLGFSAIDYITRLSDGVVLCNASHSVPELNGMRLLLKGGQMGDAHLFDRFAQQAETP